MATANRISMNLDFYEGLKVSYTPNILYSGFPHKSEFYFFP